MDSFVIGKFNAMYTACFQLDQVQKDLCFIKMLFDIGSSLDAFEELAQTFPMSSMMVIFPNWKVYLEIVKIRMSSFNELPRKRTAFSDQLIPAERCAQNVFRFVFKDDGSNEEHFDEILKVFHLQFTFASMLIRNLVPLTNMQKNALAKHFNF